MSNVNGASTTSYYNTTNFAGAAVASNATSTLVIYYCNTMYVLNAKMIEAMAATLLVAASMLYLA